MNNVDIFMSQLQVAFESNSDTNNSVAMAAYMKDHFIYYGIKSPVRKKIISELWKTNKINTIDDLKSFMHASWKKKEREWQYSAMDIMGKFKNKYDEETIILLEHLITHKSWWDTVDWLASNGVGPYFILFPKKRNYFINKWMKSGDIWLQRTCLIFQLKYKENTDFELMKNCILELKGSKEFFINKGAGWALRQYSKFNAEHVRIFLKENPDFHTIIMREANKYI